MKNNIVLDKSFMFALKIIDLYKKLISNKEFVISNQLLKSATSIGANINEATAAASRKDFVNKMVIASKEARETKYWLELLNYAKFYETDYFIFLNDVNELIKLLTAIIKTSQNGSDYQN
ncbi:MAG: four helix bundle protein [bacterium]